MSEVSAYSVKPRIFLIKPHHTIDDEMLDRFITRHVVPAFDMFPDINLTDADTERLLMSQEVANLPMDMFDAVEQALGALSEIIGVDWIAVPRSERKELFVAQVDHYEHIRYQAHLHVKHYIRFKNAFTIPYNKLDEALVRSLGSQTNLTELPFELYKIIQRHKPEEAQEYPETSIADGDDEDLSYLDGATVTLSEARKSIEEPLSNVESQPTLRKTVIDNQIVTPSSLPSAQRQLDSISKYKRLHNSVMELHDYLRTHMTTIAEYHSPDSDLAFKGIWHDGTDVVLLAFNLTDKRENSAWLIKFLSKDEL